MQRNFDNLCKWAHDAGLVINASNTKTIHIHSPHVKVSHTPTITAHDHQCLHRGPPAPGCCACPTLQFVDQHTYLGLIIDKHFKWGPHIEVVSDKLRSINAKLSILKYKLPFFTLRLLYLALADSIISYGLCSYGRTYRTYLNRIYKLQLSILKNIVPNNIRRMYKDDENGLFEYCKVMSVYEKVNMSIILDKFDKINSLTKINRHGRLRVLDRLPTYQLPKTTNTYGMRTWKYILPDIINRLPKEMQLKLTNSNAKKCKTILKQFYLKSVQT